MKVFVQNLGPIRQAEFELGDLTIICGENNTGKTYITYATYGFFDYLRSEYSFKTPREQVGELLKEGTLRLDLRSYAEKFSKHIAEAAKTYTKILDKVFAGNENLFANTVFSLTPDTVQNYERRSVELRMGSAEKNIVKISKSADSTELLVSLIIDQERSDLPPLHFIEQLISDGIKEVVLKAVIPKPFICSAERTGSAIFQKELDFTRNRIVELLGDRTAKLHPLKLLGKFSGEYPIAVRRNVDFIRELPTIVNRKSYILQNHPEILETFADIIGGDYKATKDGEIQYIPRKPKRVKLALVESSSAVRSLLDTGFYLRHVAQPGDLLMIDEPELNLHPENQRRVARLFARLVNLGIRIFITTHSDYIIKELNTLIMLNHDKPHLKSIAQKEGYDAGELISSEKVKVYIAEEALVRIGNATRRSRCQTLTLADIDPVMGIEARSFDTTIDAMNRIQEEIVWGGEE